MIPAIKYKIAHYSQERGGLLVNMLNSRLRGLSSRSSCVFVLREILSVTRGIDWEQMS